MKLCAHCRTPLEKNEIKWDHVPPDCMFPKGTVGKIQVPSCRPCNEGASNDDEFFRLLAIDAAANASADEPRAATARALSNPKKAALLKALEAKAVPIEVETPEGTAHGYKVPMSTSRLTLTAEKIVRGLYYHHKGYPIPEGIVYPCICLSSDDRKQVVRQLRGVLEILKTVPLHEIGKGVFSYRYAYFNEEPPHNAVFWLGFYGWAEFVSIVGPLPEDASASEWEAYRARRP